jgi:HSP20 family molecular chaperone IbpA
MALARSRDIPSLFARGWGQFSNGFEDLLDVVDELDSLAKDKDYSKIKTFSTDLLGSIAGNVTSTDTTISYSFDAPGVSKVDVKEAKVEGKRILRIKASNENRDYTFTRFVDKNVDTNKSTVEVADGIIKVTFQKIAQEDNDSVDLLK